MLFSFFACTDDSEDSTPSMELVLAFSGENAESLTGVSLTYGASGDESIKTNVMAAVSGTKALFTLSSEYADSYGYFKIYGIKVYAGETLLSAETDDNLWFKFNEDQTHTISYKLSKNSDNSIKIEGLSMKLGETFIRGFDASEVDFYEQENNVIWTDSDGKQKDFFQILANHGVNTVRLRIWNDPNQFAKRINTGMNSLERTISMAKRVKAANLDLMLDFHYSDTWADPGRQLVPAAWKNLKSVDEVASSLSSYTTEVLQTLKNEAGIVPKYVQIGNEINNGLMTHYGTDSSDNNKKEEFAFAGTSWGENRANFITYLSAGCHAVRSFDSGIKIVLHVAHSKYVTWIFEPLKEAALDYDIIGLSYYPWEESHESIAVLKSNIEALKSEFGKKILIAECSAHWHDDSNLSAQNQSYIHLVDPLTSKVYSDLETGEKSGVNYVKGTVQNQANTIRHIIEESAKSGGCGVFVWGGDLYGNYKWGMFDSSGKALQSLDVFKIE